MKAKIKATGEIVEVYERYDDLAMETVYEGLARSYSRDELDFSVPETRKEAKESAKTFASETAVLEGWIARDRLNNALFLHDEEPWRAFSGYQTDGKEDEWRSDTCPPYPIDSNSFPSVTWQSEPKCI